MAIQIARFTLTSDAPLISHNSQLANPLNKFAKKLKEISSKRKKVDADIEAMAKIEFLGGLYMGVGGPVIPGVMIEAAVRGGAKKTREGKDVQAAVYTTQDFPMVYDGPKDAEGLWADERFVNQSIVTVQRAKINRTRPIFPEWSAEVALHYEDSVVTLKKLADWLTIAGLQCGLGDWRPRYGRFSVTAA